MSKELSSRGSPALLGRADFKASVAAAKAIATARQEQILTPGLLLAGVVRASQEVGEERAAVKAALGEDGLRQAFDLLMKLSIDPSMASNSSKDNKMPLSQKLQKLLNDHKGSGFAEFVAQLLVTDHKGEGQHPS